MHDPVTDRVEGWGSPGKIPQRPWGGVGMGRTVVLGWRDVDVVFAPSADLISP